MTQKVTTKILKIENLNIHKELVEKSWILEFSIKDPDGNKVENLQNK